MDELRADGAGSIHLVVWVPWDEAEARLAAALAAGGSIVRHNVEEVFWTLADPAGNEVDLATTSPPEPRGSASSASSAPSGRPGPDMAGTGRAVDE
jgi:hypothetical protein